MIVSRQCLCSCGTTFSRKDKLLGHINLFPGHSPAISLGDVKASGVTDGGRNNKTMTEIGSLGSNFLGNSMDDVDDLDLEDVDDDPSSFYPLNFGSFKFGRLDDIPQQSFDVSESLFSYFPSGSCDYVQTNGDNSDLNHLG